MRLLVRYLIVVMLLTVLSPKFGWESIGASVAHAHAAEQHAADSGAVAMAEADCHEHHAHHAPAMQDQPAAALDDAASADWLTAADADMGDHHCCPGHVIGHLLGGLSAGVALPSLSSLALLRPAGMDRFSSRIPDGLERPPRAAA